MKKYVYVVAAALAVSGTGFVPAHAEVGVALDTFGSSTIRNGSGDAAINADVSAKAEVNARKTATTSADISTRANSELTATLHASDERVDKVTVASNSIDMKYRVDGKFLGLVRTTIPVTVEVESDGSLELDYPWYAFLYSGRPADLEAKVEAAANANGSWDAESFTATKRAELIARIHAALKANVDVSATASTSASVY